MHSGPRTSPPWAVVFLLLFFSTVARADCSSQTVVTSYGNYTLPASSPSTFQVLNCTSGFGQIEFECTSNSQYTPQPVWNSCTYQCASTSLSCTGTGCPLSVPSAYPGTYSFICPRNYGYYDASCSGGNWTLLTNECSPIYECASTVITANGTSFTLPATGLSSYNWSCPAPYVGTAEFQCVQVGPANSTTYQTQLIQNNCYIPNCPSFSFYDASLSLTLTVPSTSPNTNPIQCSDVNYRLQGTIGLSCSADGTWSPISYVGCSPVLCAAGSGDASALAAYNVPVSWNAFNATEGSITFTCPSPVYSMNWVGTYTVSCFYDSSFQSFYTTISNSNCHIGCPTTTFYTSYGNYTLHDFVPSFQQEFCDTPAGLIQIVCYDTGYIDIVLNTCQTFCYKTTASCGPNVTCAVPSEYSTNYTFSCGKDYLSNYNAICADSTWQSVSQTCTEYQGAPPYSCNATLSTIHGNTYQLPNFKNQTEYQMPCAYPLQGTIDLVCGNGNGSFVSPPTTIGIKSYNCAIPDCPAYTLPALYRGSTVINVTVPATAPGVSVVKFSAYYDLMDITVYGGCNSQGVYNQLTDVNVTSYACRAGSVFYDSIYNISWSRIQNPGTYTFACQNTSSVQYRGTYTLLCNGSSIDVQLTDMNCSAVTVCPSTTLTLSTGNQITTPSFNETGTYTYNCTGIYSGTYTVYCPSISQSLLPVAPVIINDYCHIEPLCPSTVITLPNGIQVTTPSFYRNETYVGQCTGITTGTYTVSCLENPDPANYSLPTLLANNCSYHTYCPITELTSRSGYTFLSLEVPVGTLTYTACGPRDNCSGEIYYECTDNQNYTSTNGFVIVNDTTQMYPLCPQTNVTLQSGAVVTIGSLYQNGSFSNYPVYCTGSYGGYMTFACNYNTAYNEYGILTVLSDECYKEPLCPSETLTLSGGDVVTTPSFYANETVTYPCSGNYVGNYTLQCTENKNLSLQSAPVVVDSHCVPDNVCYPTTLNVFLGIPYTTPQMTANQTISVICSDLNTTAYSLLGSFAITCTLNETVSPLSQPSISSNTCTQGCPASTRLAGGTDNYTLPSALPGIVTMPCQSGHGVVQWVCDSQTYTYTDAPIYEGCQYYCPASVVPCGPNRNCSVAGEYQGNYTLACLNSGTSETFQASCTSSGWQVTQATCSPVNESFVPVCLAGVYFMSQFTVELPEYDVGAYYAPCPPPFVSSKQVATALQFNCSASGIWYNVIDSCYIPDCPAETFFDPIINQTVIVPATSPGQYGAPCTGQNNLIAGQVTQLCSASGQWQQMLALNCTRLACSPGSNSTVEGYTVSWPGLYNVSTNYTYTCPSNSSFQTQGTYTVECVQSGGPATLKQFGCELLNLCPSATFTLLSGYVANTPNLTAYGDYTYYCTGKYSGSYTVQCLQSSDPLLPSPQSIKYDNCYINPICYPTEAVLYPTKFAPTAVNITIPPYYLSGGGLLNQATTSGSLGPGTVHRFAVGCPPPYVGEYYASCTKNSDPALQNPSIIVANGCTSPCLATNVTTQYGTYSLSTSDTPNELVSLPCQKGYGIVTFVCSLEGQWSPYPFYANCSALCPATNVTCGTNVTCSVPSAYENTYTFNCPTNLNQTFSASCTSTGWSVNSSACTPEPYPAKNNTCGASIYTLQYAVVDVPAARNGDVFVLKCPEPYTGTIEFECFDAAFNGTLVDSTAMTVSCVMSDCPAFSFFDLAIQRNVTVPAISPGSTTVNTAGGSLGQDCLDTATGQVVGHTKVSCTTTGQLSLLGGLGATGCDPVICSVGDYSLPDGTIVFHPDIFLDNTVTMYCPSPYVGGTFTLGCNFASPSSSLPSISLVNNACLPPGSCVNVDISPISYLPSFHLDAIYDNNSTTVPCGGDFHGTVEIGCSSSIATIANYNCVLNVSTGFYTNTTYVSVVLDQIESTTDSISSIPDCFGQVNLKAFRGRQVTSANGTQYCCSNYGVYSGYSCTVQRCSGLKDINNGYFYNTATSECLATCVPFTGVSSGHQIGFFTGLSLNATVLSNFTIQTTSNDKIFLVNAGPNADKNGVVFFIEAYQIKKARTTAGFIPMGCKKVGTLDTSTQTCVVLENCDTTSTSYTAFITYSSPINGDPCYAECYSNQLP